MPPTPKPDPEVIDLAIEPKEPKRFVRTFQSDSTAVQKGGTPGFSEAESLPPEPPPTPEIVPAPTPTSKSAKPLETPVFEASDLLKNESLIPPSISHQDLGSFFPKFSLTKEPPQETPAFKADDLAPPDEKIVEPVAPLIPSALSRLIEGSILPGFSFKKEPETISLMPPLSPPPPPTPVAKEAAPIHTYTSDFADHIKTEEASTATILAAEGDASAKSIHTGISFNIPLVIGVVLFLVLGSIGAYVTYHYFDTPVPVQTIAQVVVLPIVVDEREEISGVGKEIENALIASIAKPLKAGHVRLLYTALATTTGNDVFNALKPPAPNVLMRNINASGSMAGIIHVGNTSTPFFILSVSSYGDTFAGMLAWEPTLGKDVATLFTPSATSTRPFRDEIISNHDVRVLRDVTGQSIVMYGYSDLRTLLIARDESVYKELLKRLAASRPAP